eukprot:COSAG03_NODE_3270_length_2115_cov_57.634921_2_plen_101_part_00
MQRHTEKERESENQDKYRRTEGQRHRDTDTESPTLSRVADQRRAENRVDVVGDCDVKVKARQPFPDRAGSQRESEREPQEELQRERERKREGEKGEKTCC